jgi:hypothetical protein
LIAGRPHSILLEMADEAKPNPSEEARSNAPSRRSPKVTATTVGVAATLLAAAAGLITALTPWFGGGAGDKVTASTPTGPETTGVTLDRLIVAKSLEHGGPFTIVDNGQVCRQTFSDLGYRIEPLRRFRFCDSLINPQEEVAALRSVRVEATVLWSAVPPSTYKHFGAGEASLSCRGNGLGSVANAYFGSLTNSGHWELNRYVKGKQERVESGDDSALPSEEGDTRRLRLDCVEIADDSLQLNFYVDGRFTGTYTDSDPLVIGLVGVSAGSYTKSPIAVTFRELRVFGPSG